MVNNILLYTITYILLGENMIINYLKSLQGGNEHGKGYAGL